MINEQPEENPQIDNGTQAGTAQAVWTEQDSVRIRFVWLRRITAGICSDESRTLVESEIIHKKLVAFLPDNPKRWKEMQALYADYYRQRENTEVCVIPLPLFAKNLYGEDCGRTGRIR
ncbi:MAG: hypothetical protein ACLRWA_06365 [Lachnospira sp.]